MCNGNLQRGDRIISRVMGAEKDELGFRRRQVFRSGNSALGKTVVLHEPTEASSEMLFACVFDDNIGIDAAEVVEMWVEVDAIGSHFWEVAPKIMSN